MIKKIWRKLRSPSIRFSLGGLLITGFLAGALAWGGFNYGLESTNTEKFCLSCHEMKINAGKEYTGTVHDSNASGVRATCPDCHVPKTFGAKMFRKLEASNDLLQSFLGSIDTPEKFEQRRGILALREWKRMKNSDSQTCRNCHTFSSMDLAAQNQRARTSHTLAKENKQTCIDCHKGIAHELPINAFELEKQLNAEYEAKHPKTK